ncbi:MAG: hypothetical protein HKN42_16205 [Granulosicoccus sp.]|nr:hypothetical protein [Granulosicoccus sp.]
MNKFNCNTITRLALLVLAALAMSSCASVVNREPPSIAHIHIGHAITAWPLAPKKQGLLVAAELASVAAVANAELMLKAAREGDLERAQKFLRATATEVDPGFLDKKVSNEYGLRKAAAEAITHLQLASEVDDASANVQRTVTTTRIKAEDLIDRSDELLAFLDAGSKAQSVEEMEIIAEEIVRTLKTIAGGPDISGSYSLFDFRQDIEAMVAREDPPYETVESYYLFNLVKLPDGQWGFASRSSRGSAGVGY